MRDLLDRLGCFLQVALGGALFFALDRWTTLPGWGAAALAFVGSYFAMAGLMAALSALDA